MSARTALDRDQQRRLDRMLRRQRPEDEPHRVGVPRQERRQRLRHAAHLRREAAVLAQRLVDRPREPDLRRRVRRALQRVAVGVAAQPDRHLPRLRPRLRVLGTRRRTSLPTTAAWNCCSIHLLNVNTVCANAM
jgi:hypothetical protein